MKINNLTKSLLLAAALAAAASGGTAAAALITVTTDDPALTGFRTQGWVSDTWGNNVLSNANTYVGQNSQLSYFRNFFTFNLGSIDGTVTGATLRIQGRTNQPDNDPYETYGLYHVSTDAYALNTLHGTSSSIYSDLGSGPSYGSFVVQGGLLSEAVHQFSLNSTAVQYINASLGDFFSIGGKLESQDLGEHLFSGDFSSYLFLDVDPPDVVIDPDPGPESDPPIAQVSGPAPLGLLLLGTAVLYRRKAPKDTSMN